MNIYPLKFEPILQEKIWGGSRLKDLFNKKTDKQNVGESWEISGVEGNISVVDNGVYKGLSLVEMLKTHNKDLVGSKNYDRFGDEFPLLIKFLDAKENLSVQVHPNDEIARKDHSSFGKTEMWYIMDHEEDAEIIVGMKDKQADTEVLRTVGKDNVYDIFETSRVSKGDAYFIPAGKVHAIGAGVVAAEIQQTSDITYRVYDWDRIDNSGSKRELHLDQSINSTKEFEEESKKDFKVKANEISNVVNCNYFTTNIFQVNHQFEREYSNLDSFVILMCVEGSCKVSINGCTESVQTGETILLPATATSTHFSSRGAKFMEVYIA
ncbi:mannose-6-phosphate isomerase, type 1 [Nonlabens sp. Hel1_33_55]|uniref:type I phosphomannose isomerase catalytic subunit n=1 Tax=Nonlabens sp. Hel1_33_55 TaxID=1336802 RepID=UPI000875CB0A|nr:type I phosphomannose isomerase catalytic subunit [Nonlabens sp. Hel1_33_55]SCX99399.1 mannose-6-phosphate isomerase, type 1 [Nonlabens sp. Hel1_33_55]